MMRNNIIYKYLVLLVLVTNFSCETTDLDLLENPNSVQAENLDPQFLFNSIQLDFNNFVSATSGPFSFAAQVTRQFSMTGSSIYQSAFSPGSFNGIWSGAYANVLSDIKALEEFPSADNYSYHLGVSKIMKAYILSTLVDLFGDIPLSEALQGSSNELPGRDSQVDVYKFALSEIDSAIALLNTDSVIEPLEDFYYGVSEASPSSWITAGNSLKLKMLNDARLGGSDLGINIELEIQNLLNTNNLIDTVDEDWQFNYGNNRLNPNTRHPGYNNYYEAAAGGYISNYFMWELITEKGIVDPRTRYYFFRQDGNTTNEDIFTLGCTVQSPPGHYNAVTSLYDIAIPMPFCVASNNGYWGRDHGDDNGIPPDGQKRTVFGTYPVGGLFDANQVDDVQNQGEDGLLGMGIQPIILSSNIEFIKAEIALVYGIGNANTSLENAIRNSISKTVNFGDLDPELVIVPDNPNTAANEQVLQGAFFPSQAEIDTYVTTVLTKFMDAGTTNGKMNLLMKELHIATYGNAIEAYNAYRRTGFPNNMQPSLNPSPGGYYRAAYYPANSVNANVNSGQAEISRQIFWDKNAANFIN